MEQRSKNGDDPDQLQPQEPAEPLPCAKGCGFFGSAATGGLCSMCFRDSLRRAAEAQRQASAEAEATSRERDDEQGAKTKKSRCTACGRKVGLVGFECRCGGVFCGEHRYSDRHDCGFDYRGAGRDAISQANPVVRGDKVDKF